MSQINITLKEFIDSNQGIIGFDFSSQCAYDLINRARIIAYPIGDWIGTMVYRPVALSGCFFTMPYDLEVIREAKNICGRHIGIDSIISRHEFDCCYESLLTRMEGRTHFPFQLTERPLCFWAINKGDKGSKMRVVYIDWGGTMRDEELELGYTNSEAVRLFAYPRTITHLSKGSTKGYVIASDGVEVAHFSPSDKNPMFTTYRLNNLCKATCIAIYAKKKYIPYSITDEEAVLDINPEALTSLIIAIKAKDARAQGWIAEYSSSVSLAKNFLNAELTNEQSTTVGIATVEYHSQLTESLNQDY